MVSEKTLVSVAAASFPPENARELFVRLKATYVRGDELPNRRDEDMETEYRTPNGAQLLYTFDSTNHKKGNHAKLIAIGTDDQLKPIEDELHRRKYIGEQQE